MRNPVVRLFILVPILLTPLVLIESCSGEDESTLLGPIAHIDADHLEIDETHYFLLNGAHSYMHKGGIIEYEWLVVKNDTEEYYLHGPFQIIEISDVSKFNITLTVTTEDTRQDTATMTIKLRDSGYDYTLMSYSVRNDPELVEKLENERTIIVEKKSDPLLLYIIIAILSTLLVVSILVIIVILRRSRKK